MNKKQYQDLKRDIDAAYDRDVLQARRNYDRKMNALNTLWEAVSGEQSAQSDQPGPSAGGRRGPGRPPLSDSLYGPPFAEYCREAIASLDGPFRMRQLRGALSEAAHSLLRERSKGMLGSTITQMVNRKELVCLEEGGRGRSGLYDKGPRWHEYGPAAPAEGEASAQAGPSSDADDEAVEAIMTPSYGRDE